MTPQDFLFRLWLAIGNTGVADPAVMRAIRQEFDAKFYRKTYPDVFGSDHKLLVHYLRHGWKEGRDPSADFSTSGYLKSKGLLVPKGTNPLLHYLNNRPRNGSGSPRRRANDVTVSPIERNLVRPYFNAAYYRSGNPGLAGDDEALLDHFLTVGWKLGRDPRPDFSLQRYVETYPDVETAENNPLVHYLSNGRNEGRKAIATGPARRKLNLQFVKVPEAGEPSEPVNKYGIAFATLADTDLMRPFFKAGFYRVANPEIDGDDDDLLEHFLTIGWVMGLDPRPDFSTAFYLAANSDVAGVWVNPAMHYLKNGRLEGRRSTGSGPLPLLRDAAAQTVAPHLQMVMVRPGPQNTPVPPALTNPAALDIHWIIPDFARGAGGHMTIFRMVRLMEEAGHRCKIWIERAAQGQAASLSYDEIIKYFQCVEAEVAFIADGFFDASGDVLIATGWTTAFVADKARGFAAKFYLVQDHEPEFYPSGTDNKLALASYSLDLACICASPWLSDIMTRRYGRWARAFHLAYDHDVYFPATPPARADGPVRIAVYARDHTARRCVQLALMALDQLAQEPAPIEVHFFGQHELPFHSAAYSAFNHGVLDPADLAILYQSCDIGICFSATNYSLVPQEMMACGLPVVELDGESTRAIFPKDVVTFAGPDPLDIVAKLKYLIARPDSWAVQAQAALNWVEAFTWEGAALDVMTAITDHLAETKKLGAPVVQRPRGTLLDVVIPTHNGLSDVQAVVAALRRQRAVEAIQIHCIDSSSTDGTQDWLDAQADISLTVIDKGAFQHGRTRNYGAAQGRAPLIAMLTQDAVPVNGNWAGDILKMMAHFPQAGGLFGRHRPYPNHPKFVRDEIDSVFKGWLRFPLLLTKDTDREKWNTGDPGWRQLLHFYSDNNSAMRRAVWREHPYPEIDYGEDQVWADTIVKAGYGKLYAPTVMVYHSHDYSPEATFVRAKTESAFFYRQFGYHLGDGTEAELEDRIVEEQDAARRKCAADGLTGAETQLRIANIAAKQRGWRAGLQSALVAAA